jgi:large subunit ribosomal protein L35
MWCRSSQPLRPPINQKNGVKRERRPARKVAFAAGALYKTRLHTDVDMPKLKTKSGAKKRFGRTASGEIKRNWGHKRHRLISKSKQGKRLRRGTTTMEPGDAKLVLTYMPYLRS